jgi:hypothetical protein
LTSWLLSPFWKGSVPEVVLCHSTCVAGVLMSTTTNDRSRTMTNTIRIPKAELSGVQGSLLEMAIRKKIGRVPDASLASFAVMAPAVMS